MLIRPSRTAKAFTLLELIVVIVILGLLAALAIPTFARVTKKSQDAATASSVSAILRDARALMAFDDSTTWAEATTTAIEETSAATASGLLAASTLTAVDAASAATPSDPRLTPRDQGVFLADASRTGATFVSLRSASGAVCFGVASLTSATTPSCRPEATSGTTVDTVRRGDAFSDGTTAPLPPGVTPAGVAKPAAPIALTASISGTTATVTWSAPAGNPKDAPTSYVVTSSAGQVVTLTPVDGALATTATFTGLPVGQALTFTVVALNSAGAGAASAPSAPVTPAARPDAPTGVVASVSGTTATLTWSAPASTNGSPVTSYDVYANGLLVKVSSGAGLSTTVPGLEGGKPVTFTVAASNSVGVGAQSSASNSVIPADAPLAPTGVNATAAAGGALVNWSASLTRGAPVTNYSVTATPPSGTPVVVTSTGTSASLTGLTSGVSYVVTVVANSTTGSSPTSSPVSVVPLTTQVAPASAPALTVTGSGATASASWSAVTGTSSAPVSGYRLYQASSPAGPWTVARSTSTTSYSATLTMGAAACFYVTAYNDSGESSPSATKCYTYTGQFYQTSTSQIPANHTMTTTATGAGTAGLITPLSANYFLTTTITTAVDNARHSIVFDYADASNYSYASYWQQSGRRYYSIVQTTAGVSKEVGSFSIVGGSYTGQVLYVTHTSGTWTVSSPDYSKSFTVAPGIGNRVGPVQGVTGNGGYILQYQAS
jgi:prepilin-type N-terminal cleavage/methylation domain-containing protein